MRGFIGVDAQLRTSAPHVFAAGDVTGRLMLVPQALQDGFVAGSNAVRGLTTTVGAVVVPIGSFTDPEYAQVGLTEASARASREVIVTTVRFDETTRTIIDGRTFGFCKLIVDRRTRAIVGCHVVGERAVEIVQTAAIAMAARHSRRRARAHSALVSHVHRHARSRGRDRRPPPERRGRARRAGDNGPDADLKRLSRAETARAGG